MLGSADCPEPPLLADQDPDPDKDRQTLTPGRIDSDLPVHQTFQEIQEQD